MALWGDKDNISVGTGATAYISSYTKTDTYGGYLQQVLVVFGVVQDTRKKVMLSDLVTQVILLLVLVEPNMVKL